MTLTDAELADLIRRSTALARANDWGAEALHVNRRIVEVRPSASGAFMRLGRCLMEAWDWDAARTAYQRVVELEASTRRISNAQKRIAECEEALASDACQSYREALSRGLMLRDNANHRAARHWLRRAYALTRLPKERTTVLVSWASALRSQRKFGEALRVLEQSLKVDPSRTSNKASYVTLIATLIDRGELVRALAEAEVLLEAHPRDLYVAKACGRLFWALHAKTGEAKWAERAERCFAG